MDKTNEVTTTATTVHPNNSSSSSARADVCNSQAVSIYFLAFLSLIAFLLFLNTVLNCCLVLIARRRSRKHRNTQSPVTLRAKTNDSTLTAAAAATSKMEPKDSNSSETGKMLTNKKVKELSPAGNLEPKAVISTDKGQPKVDSLTSKAAAAMTLGKQMMTSIKPLFPPPDPAANKSESFKHQKQHKLPEGLARLQFMMLAPPSDQSIQQSLMYLHHPKTG